MQTHATLSTFFKYIPDIFITKEMCLEAASYNLNETLPYIPPKLQKEDIYIECIKAYTTNRRIFDGIPGEENQFIKEILEAIPKHCKNNQFFVGLIKLKLVPLTVIIEECTDDPMLLTDAFAENAISLSDVPSDLHTYELCKQEIQRGGSLYHLFRYMEKKPLIFNNDILKEISELCVLAAKNNYNTLNNIPEKFRNEEIYAVYIARELKKQNIYDDTAKLLLFNLPHSIKESESFWLKLIQNATNASFIHWIPKNLQRNPNIVAALMQSTISIPINDITMLDYTNFDPVLKTKIGEQLKERIEQLEKPIILILYYPEDGVQYTDMLLEHLKNKSEAEIILISPTQGQNHPLISNPDFMGRLNGVILPGGPNVPNNPDDPRKKFETFLLEEAIKRTIPVLGICRGHQMIGEHFGGTIRNIDNHYHTTTKIMVKPQNAKLRGLLEHKHSKWQQENNPDKKDELAEVADNKNRNMMIYHSHCARHQGLFFTQPRDKAKINIVAKAPDGTIEAMEINNHIMTYQHHHEFYQNRIKPEGKLAKSLLKLFTNAVDTHHGTHKKQATPNQH